jgi:hypothetical protein
VNVVRRQHGLSNVGALAGRSARVTVQALSAEHEGSAAVQSDVFTVSHAAPADPANVMVID